MEETLIKLRILASAEIKLAQLRAQRLAYRTILVAIALGLLLLAVVMVNLGAYQLLTQTYSEPASAFLIAAANTVLVVLLAFVVCRFRAGPDEIMAQEIRDMALDELTAEVGELKQGLGTDVKRLRSGFSILSKGSQIGAGLASAAPVIGMILDVFRERRKEKKEKKAQTEQEEADE